MKKQDVKVRSSEPPRREVREWRQKSPRERNHLNKPIHRQGIPIIELLPWKDEGCGIRSGPGWFFDFGIFL
jgi:hypothetical protein